MIYRFITDCKFAGCDTTHYVEVDDNITDAELDEMLNDYIEADIEPQGGYELITDEDEIASIEENGYDIE